MKILGLIQVVVAILLVVSILLQNRGSGLGLAYGDSFGGYYTKRGLEKFLVYVSGLLGFAFLALSVAVFVFERA